MLGGNKLWLCYVVATNLVWLLLLLHIFAVEFLARKVGR